MMTEKLLLELSSTLKALADNLEKMAVAKPITPTTATPKVTLEQVRSVLAEISHAGRTADVRVLLEKHGVNKLSEIPADQYEQLLLEAEELRNG